MVASYLLLKELNSMKAKIAIIGKGNIGWAIKQLLKDDYELKHGDITEA